MTGRSGAEKNTKTLDICMNICIYDTVYDTKNGMFVQYLFIYRVNIRM